MKRRRANDAFGDDVRRLIGGSELSIEELALRAGLDPDHLSHVLRSVGRRS